MVRRRRAAAADSTAVTVGDKEGGRHGDLAGEGDEGRHRTVGGGGWRRPLEFGKGKRRRRNINDLRGKIFGS